MLETHSAQSNYDDQVMRMKTCSGCRNKIASDFAFCRWCGQKQVVTLQRYLTEIETRMLDNTPRSYNTAPLANEAGVANATGVLHQPTMGLSDSGRLISSERFSKRLVNTVIDAFQSNSIQSSNIVIRKASAVVLSIFVSLIFILSAPVDAVVMAKNLLK